MTQSVAKKITGSNFIDVFRRRILSWYDVNARQLPWRRPPCHDYKPDPYHVWLSEIMLQQTTVPAVIPYFQKLTALWRGICDLASAQQDNVMREWAGLGYYARARNLHKCAQIIANDYGGVFPHEEAALIKLPGIGAYTAAAIASIAFDKPAVVIDGNIDRIISRVFCIDTPLPEGKKDIRDKATMLAEGRIDRPGDYAQALMDLGSMICTPKNPQCSACPVREYCGAFEVGQQDAYPVKKPKAIKPVRYGALYFVTDSSGRILLEKRPDKGLLGGMSAFPSSDWQEESLSAPPFQSLSFQKISGQVRHVFTHFALVLDLYHTTVKTFPQDQRYFIEEIASLDKIGFPTVFKKAVRFIPR